MSELLGHLHPLIVHLPIGILVLAFVITLLPERQRQSMASALYLSLILSTAGALFASGTGYLLSRSGDYDQNILDRHFWLGISTSVLSMTAILLKKYRRPIVWFAVIAMSITGHYGGSLTHGEDYLFSKRSTEISMEKEPPEIDTASDTSASDIAVHTAVKQRFIYRDEILPILKNKCYNCHSSVKKKGGLRLDGEVFIMKGGKNGNIVSRKDPNNSPLYTHLVLPMEDELHMPPKGKKQLSSSEIELIRRWIGVGAPFGAYIAEDGIPNQAVTEKIESAPPTKDAEWVAMVEKEEAASSLEEEDLKPLRSEGLIVDILPSNRVAVNFVNTTISASHILLMSDISNDIEAIKLTGQPLTDSLLGSFPMMKNLKRLHLAKTKITDEALFDLSKFPRLNSLNLYETSVTDRGLNSLRNIKPLRKLYLWKTECTEEGIAKLRSFNKELSVDNGTKLLNAADTLKKN